jgi:hypothetical protein
MIYTFNKRLHYLRKKPEISHIEIFPFNPVFFFPSKITDCSDITNQFNNKSIRNAEKQHKKGRLQKQAAFIYN